MTNPTAVKLETPKIVNGLADAVFPAMAMLAGMKLDIFTPLKNGPLTTEEISSELGVPPRQLGPLLYALVEASILTVENGRFSNTDEATRFLVRGTPNYVGARHMSFSRQWSGLLKTADSIRSDSPQARLDFSVMSPEDLENFYAGGYATAFAAGKALVERYDFSAYHRLVDVAGGSGGLAVGIAESCPSIQATVVDRASYPAVCGSRRCLPAGRAQSGERGRRSVFGLIRRGRIEELHPSLVGGPRPPGSAKYLPVYRAGRDPVCLGNHSG